ncbi:hypothetical protein [Plesiocystis pacifica]|uniref:hypothetical protein n=1 Tax=Plesiocystis pacifica TaxID=191768 RepID=UPI0005D46D11|nr:hypothetical protein [Plesiocystis pacifica]
MAMGPRGDQRHPEQEREPGPQPQPAAFEAADVEVQVDDQGREHGDHHERRASAQVLEEPVPRGLRELPPPLGDVGEDQKVGRGQPRDVEENSDQGQAQDDEDQGRRRGEGEGHPLDAPQAQQVLAHGREHDGVEERALLRVRRGLLDPRDASRAHELHEAVRDRSSVVRRRPVRAEALQVRDEGLDVGGAEARELPELPRADELLEHRALANPLCGAHGVLRGFFTHVAGDDPGHVQLLRHDPSLAQTPGPAASLARSTQALGWPPPG